VGKSKEKLKISEKDLTDSELEMDTERDIDKQEESCIEILRAINRKKCIDRNSKSKGWSNRDPSRFMKTEDLRRDLLIENIGIALNFVDY
jgi:hypothetical protein